MCSQQESDVQIAEGNVIWSLFLGATERNIVLFSLSWTRQWIGNKTSSGFMFSILVLLLVALLAIEPSSARCST